jgi:carotenoid 1,2-hydratase
VIAFVGSVFSPWYAAARRRGTAQPENHVSINVALYGRGARWAMTERGGRSLEREASSIAVGPSSMAWNGDRLEIAIDEWAVPLPRRIRGTIVIDAGPVFSAVHPLDPEGRHRWRPILPFARARLHMEVPGMAWEGPAYVDTNDGDEPLESGFRYWTWSRAARPDGSTVFYDVETRHGTQRSIALALGADGSAVEARRPPFRTLPPTLWGVRRSVRSEAAPAAVRGFEDAPFYTRTGVDTVIGGQTCPTVCESVDLDRFGEPWVQALLPFRMPRRS